LDERPVISVSGWLLKRGDGSLTVPSRLPMKYGFG
jgi:hypothetical protein